jgi:hypothetical protein
VSCKRRIPADLEAAVKVIVKFIVGEGKAEAGSMQGKQARGVWAAFAG